MGISFKHQHYIKSCPDFVGGNAETILNKNGELFTMTVICIYYNHETTTNMIMITDHPHKPAL